MKVLLFLLPLVAGIISGVVPSNETTCIYVPKDIKYLFYNIQNPRTPIIIPSDDFTGIKNTHFDKSKETLVLVHGSGGDSTGPLVQNTTATITAAKIDVNVIAVEWQQYQLRNPDVRKCAIPFAKIVGTMLEDMQKNHGLQYSNVVIVGHSIAGGFYGEISAYLKNEIGKIVGLETCAQKNVAKFVECIHTAHGNAAPMAHANYYPNGGGQQPHCPEYPDWRCNHWRVIDYYTESLTTNKFVGTHCDSYENFKNGSCSKNPTGIMGGIDPTTTGGKFYLDTHEYPPYAKG